MTYPGRFAIYHCETDRLNEKKEISRLDDGELDLIIHNVIHEDHELLHETLDKMSDYDIYELTRCIIEKYRNVQS